ncbi:hypothetical protein B4079_5895 [Bacillus cereus]|nr:hypothetical protein B4079_5895 [Bacillus cereus]
MPLAGFAFAIGTPLIVTVLGRKMVPAGMISVNVTLEAGILPLFVKIVAYVMTAPTSAKFVLVSFVATRFAVLICVVTILLVAFLTTAGKFGSAIKLY